MASLQCLIIFYMYFNILDICFQSWYTIYSYDIEFVRVYIWLTFAFYIRYLAQRNSKSKLEFFFLELKNLRDIIKNFPL